MKTYFHRFSAIILALFTALLPLTGCGRGSADDKAAPEQTSSAEVSPSPAAVTPSPEPSAPSPEELIETQAIAESSHQREEEYMAMFSTHALELPGFSIHMDNLIYEEALLRQYARALLNDLSEAERTAGEPPLEVTVYIVSATVDRVPAAAGRQVFCTKEDFESGGYRETLLGAAYGLKAEWQRSGLCGLVFGEAGDVSALKEYYDAGGHDLTASVSPMHLSPILADEETLGAARNTAQSLASYIIENEGFASFREAADPAQKLPAWAAELGLSAVPELPEGSGRLAEMTLKPFAKGLCVLDAENFSVYVSEDSWLRTPDELYSWLCRFFLGLDHMMEWIRSQAPIAADRAETKLAEPISIYLIDEASGTYAYPAFNRIDLSRYDGSWHEVVHLILEEDVYNNLDWICEGIAEYFSLATTSIFCPEDYVSRGFDAYVEFFEGLENIPATDDDMIFHRNVWALYQALRLPEAEEYDDGYAYSRAFAVCSFLLEGKIDRTQIRRIYDVSVAGKRGYTAGPKETDGRSLTYPQATLFVEYLFRTYGADAVLEAYFAGVPTDRAFGITYPELYSAVMADIEAQYGSFIETN